MSTIFVSWISQETTLFIIRIHESSAIQKCKNNISKYFLLNLTNTRLNIPEKKTKKIPDQIVNFAPRINFFLLLGPTRYWTSFKFIGTWCSDYSITRLIICLSATNRLQHRRRRFEFLLAGPSSRAWPGRQWPAEGSRGCARLKNTNWNYSQEL